MFADIVGFLVTHIELLTNIIVFFANLTGIILWIPQGKKTWANRHNPKGLEGISIVTQKLVAINTILWCIRGLLLKDRWLSLGTLFILPTALLTIWILKKNESTRNKRINAIEKPEAWFTFESYKQLCPADKKVAWQLFIRLILISKCLMNC